MIAVVAALLASAPVAAGAPAAIAITASATGDWRVRYTLPRPARTLVFSRAPDGSRAATWHVPPGFELIADKEGERLRRRDRAPFTHVTLTVPARYRDLPKDYAPFSPFGDGGIAFHSGRFFACAGPCPDDARWSFTLTPPRRAATPCSPGRSSAAPSAGTTPIRAARSTSAPRAPPPPPTSPP